MGSCYHCYEKKEGLSLFLRIIAGDNRKIIGVCYDI